ncbi:cytochrome P450 2J6 [Lingula anatina]|uniref:Cytochrome P450 2U1 n=1 Tax=Lingula anatina TaxID=7574 RepID=A0A1S3HXS7_LINAN|nr:cytochrome P450 2J6 [Lingula anatina]|eukprot:XP_013390837.1 cytochrome P450 2J6 [Lingula anatina]
MANAVHGVMEFFSTAAQPTVLIFVAVLLLSLWMLSLRNPRVKWPPGPVCFPVVGCLPQMMISGRRRQPTDLLPWYDTYGDIMHVKFGEQHMIMLGTYELIQEAFVKNADTVSARPTWIYFLRQIVGKDGAGVLFKSGKAWKELRRFTLSSLRDLGLGRKSLQERIQDEARYLVQNIENENGKAFSPRERIGKAVSNIISIVVFGTRYDYNDTPEMLPVLEEVLRLGEGPVLLTNLARFIMPMKKMIALVDKLYSLIRQEVEKHRQSFDPTDIRDFIDLFIKVTQEEEDPEVYTEWNVFRIIVDLYLAGTDTTANTLRWSLVHMVNHPDAQKRVQREIDQVIGQGRVAKMEDKARMPFTEATILEVFRLSTVGAGVILKTGHAWKELRRFTLSSLRDLGLGRKSLQERIQDEARYLVQNIEDENGKAFSPRDRIGKAVSNIISIVVFGTRYDYNDTPEMLPVLEEALRLGEGPLSLTNLARFIMPMKKIMSLVDKLYSLIRQEVEKHRQSFDPKDIRDFIDLFIKVTQEEEDPEVYTEWNVFRIIVDLYLAGTDTTANTLRWSLVHMVNHPDAQKRVQQEIDQVIGQGRVAKMEDKARMPFTEATVLEVFRLSTVVPLGVPHATSETTNLAGYTIPKGTVILGDLYRVLHDENNFEDAYKFKPERWLDVDGKVVKSDKLIPFSMGPRICLGKGLAEMESFIFFTTLLQNFTFKVTEGEKPPDGVEGLNTFTFTPYPYNVCAVRR